MKTVIIGGGIAGLSLGIALRKLGIDFTIAEKSAELSGSGMGFILLPNGLAALDDLGIGDQIRSVSREIREVSIMNTFGEEVRHEFIENTYCINRAKCLEVMKSALPDDALLYNRRFERFENTSDGAAKGALFEDAPTIEGEIFVGVDGSRSYTRNLLFPSHTLRYSNVKEIVCLLQKPGIGKELGHTFRKVVDKDRKLAMGMVPTGDDELVWFIQYDKEKWKFSDETRSNLKPLLLNLFQDWPSLTSDIISESDFNNVYHWQTKDMEILPSFHKSNKVLLGDAAHLSLTFTSQGANSALRDAVVFSQLLNKVQTGELTQQEAFQTFYEQRKPTLEGYLKSGRALENQFLDVSEEKYAIKIPLTT